MWVLFTASRFTATHPPTQQCSSNEVPSSFCPCRCNALSIMNPLIYSENRGLRMARGRRVRGPGDGPPGGRLRGARPARRVPPGPRRAPHLPPGPSLGRCPFSLYRRISYMGIQFAPPRHGFEGTVGGAGVLRQRFPAQPAAPSSFGY